MFFALEPLTEGYGKLFLSIIEMGCYYICQWVVKCEEEEEENV